MKFTAPTHIGTIQKRYKRFLSDVTLDSGEEIHAHVPNTGSMQTCWEPNWKVLLTYHDDPKRKMKYTLEMTYNGESWISVNTSMTNKIAQEAIENHIISELTGYQSIKPEQKILDSRIDFFLSEHATMPDCYVEVKNVTLKGENGIAFFPDAVSTRGQKHLKDLMEIKKSGKRAVMLYVINREDVSHFCPATHIDPTYSKLLREANQSGVEILAYQAKLSEKEIKLVKKIPVNL